MQLLELLLPKLKANNHRVLVFSQMTKMLDILEVTKMLASPNP
jgi:SNF2 family DNA or RNA helicase